MPGGRVLYKRDVGSGGVATSGEPATLSMFFPSRHYYSETFHVSDAYWAEIRDWSTPVLQAAPSGLAGGFASLDMAMYFYTLQTGTGDSAVESTMVAGIIAGIVILLLTANVLIALYSTAVIALVIGAGARVGPHSGLAARASCANAPCGRRLPELLLSYMP